MSPTASGYRGMTLFGRGEMGSALVSVGSFLQQLRAPRVCRRASAARMSFDKPRSMSAIECSAICPKLAGDRH